MAFWNRRQQQPKQPKEQPLIAIPLAPSPLEQIDTIAESLTSFALRNPEQASLVYGAISPNAATYDAAIQTLRAALEHDPAQASRIYEQINPTAIASSPTQEDWYWGRLATGGEEDFYWRRLSDNWYMKDVIPSTYLEILNTCYEAYNANPLAMAIVEITVSFVIGKGVKVVASRKKIQKILDAFWNDPDNHMESRVEDICRELSMYGEIYVRFFTNPFDGVTKVRLVDPALIDQIETDPEDIEHHIRYHRRPIGPSPTQTFDSVANTVDPQSLNQPYFEQKPNTSISKQRGDGGVVSPDDPLMQGRWFTAGPGQEMMQFAINKVSNAKRGKSDLATLLPWLRRYKDWLTDRVRINKYKGAFLWDVAIAGADKKTLQQKKNDYSYPPEPGSVIIHNETEKWSAVQPNINAMDAASDGRAIKLMVALGATIPEHYLSDGNNNNRATAAEMGLPTFLKFARRQKFIKLILRAILDRVLQEKIKAHQLPDNLDISSAYDIVFPEFDQSSNQELGTALSYLMGGLVQAKAQGWISDETAMQTIFKFLGEEINLHEEREKIALEMQQQAAPKKQPARVKSAQLRESAENLQGTGMMLCFYPSPEVAKALARPGGEPAEQVHLTLAYLGDMQDSAWEGMRPDIDPEPLHSLLRAWAETVPPMEGIIGGIGRFTSVPDGAKTPVYASVDAPGLAEFRTQLVGLLSDAGYYFAQDHDFTAHLTLDFIAPDAPMPDITLPANPSLSTRLDTLYLVVGNERFAFPLGGGGDEDERS